MNKEEKIYMMLGTLDYLNARLREEKAIRKRLYNYINVYEHNYKHLVGNDTYTKWKNDYDLNMKRMNEILRSIATLEEEMLMLDYQMNRHSEFEYFNEFNY